MSSTYTTNLRLEKQGNGDNPNTWGLVLNTAVIDLVDSAITAYTTVSVDTNGSDITLTNQNGATDQARSAMLEFEGSIGNNTNVIIPSTSKIYIIKDKSVRSNTPTLKIKTAGGSGLDVATSTSSLIFCDGVSVYGLNANGLGLGTAANANLSDISTQATANINGAVTSSATINIDNVSGSIVVGQTVEGIDIPEGTTVSTINSVTQIVLSTAVTIADDVALTFTNTVSVSSVPAVSVTDFRYIRVSAASTITASKTFAAPVVVPVVSLTDAASVAVNMTLGNNFALTLEGNRTLESPTGATPGQTGHIYLVQDGTGSRTLSYGGSWSFQSGTVPTVSTSINSVDLLVYNVRGVSAVDAVLLKAFSSSS
jgi:hypothetical protein|tara:strand:+ start:3 stop:1109 length:1107 start_codon:yes stop_codon:yes gene_type:complete